MNRLTVFLLFSLLFIPPLHAQEPVMYDKMKTYCFGRYLVDIPANAEVTAAGTKYLGKDVLAEKMTREEFKQRVADRIEKLKKDAFAKVQFGEFEREIPVDDVGTIVVGKYGNTPKELSYGLHAFKFDRGWAFSLMRNSNTPEILDKYIERLTTFIRTVRYRSDFEKPPLEPGVCLPHGFIANGENTHVLEEAFLSFKLKENPDVVIRVNSMLYFREFPSLLEREKEGGIARLLSKIKRLRGNKREINGMPGEESLLELPSDDKTGICHTFMWETRGELDNPDKPTLQLQMKSGEGVFGVAGVSSMETKELVSLFDAIVKTIRLRPTEAKPADAPGPQSKLPLGTKLASYHPCPQAGVWECEAQPVDGTRRQTFQTGQNLPPVMVPVARSLWQRLSGQPAEHAIDTVWTLVEYAPD